MFCSKCGTEAADDSKFCAECGQSLKPESVQQPPAPTPPPAAPQPIIVNAPPSGPYGTPGTGALWLSIFGICGITAILGIIFGIAAYREAKRRNVGQAKATWAIVIGIAWLIPMIFSWSVLGWGFNSATSNSTSTSTTTSSGEVITADAKAEVIGLSNELIKMGFECNGPIGDILLVTCTEGEIEVEGYGMQPVQRISIQLSTGEVHGFAKPESIAKVEEFVSVDDLGDDGTGTGARLFG